MDKKTVKDQPYPEITDQVIRAAFNVHNTLGAGFLKAVYENALVIELSNLGLQIYQQYPMTVYYKGRAVGEYYADLLVEDKVIIAVMAVHELTKTHEIQLRNYLKATGKEAGLLFNYGSKLEFKRCVLYRGSYEAIG